MKNASSWTRRDFLLTSAAAAALPAVIPGSALGLDGGSPASSVKGLEDEIARQRYTFNNISQEYNTMIDTIPSNLVGRFMGLAKLEYLQFEEAVATPPKIEF